MTTQTVAFNGRGLAVDWDAYLSRHDVVFLSPATDGFEGFPIGNGDMGAMAWTPPDRIQMQINKVNTWDDAPEGSFAPWEDGDRPELNDRFTSLRHPGELRIEPGLPIFDWMYLEDFEGRLSLAKACAEWRAAGPLGKVRCKAFVAESPAVVAVHYEDELSESSDRRVVLSRWGSRMFEHWYRFIRRQFLLGPEGTAAGGQDCEVWIEQPTRSLRFAMAARLAGPAAKACRFNQREAGWTLNPGKSCAFDIYISVVTSEEAPDPLAEARKRVRQAAEMGSDKVFADHRQRWHTFWSKSVMHIPDDYLENLWYLNAYQVGSAARGQYPPHFINSLWGWNRDVIPWGHYYQWNQQTYTWPLHASGHPELMLPYAKWKREGLDRAMKTAREFHNCEGAFYTDVSNRRGDQGAKDPSLAKNLAATTLTGLDLWRHYEYTLDDEYLEMYAYPVLREIVRFYLCHLKLGEDGRYHLPEGLPYESTMSRLSRDTTADLAGIKKLFPAFARSADRLGRDDDLRRRAQEAVAKLADIPLTQVPKDVPTWGGVPAGASLTGFGIMLNTGEVGHGWSERPYWLPTAPLTMPCTYHTVNAQVTPIFPANLIGLDEAGTALFEGCRNAALCFDPLSTCGHVTLPICLARLGLVDLLPEILDRWVDRYQIFSQGLFCYWQRDYRAQVAQGITDAEYSGTEHKIPSLTCSPKVLFTDPAQHAEVPRRSFAHMALEAGSIFEATLNEMLLQSYNGRIRVFPAVPSSWDVCFTLHAIGAFTVTSERRSGEILYVAVESRKGGTCRLVNPWPGNVAVRVRSAAGGKALIEGEGIAELRFDTLPGEVYIAECITQPVSAFTRETLGGEPNRGPKRKGEAQIGTPRQF
jgi:alpha-L-fucosidase 2